MTEQISELRNFAIGLAMECGQILMDEENKQKSLEWKLKNNFKTHVDDLSDTLARKRISEAYPSHSIYSEEADAIEQKSEYSWIVDPLDGTLPYTYGISDHFSVSIALAKNKRPIIGVIYAPKRNEMYVGVEGLGATLNGKPIKVRDVSILNKIIIGFDLGKLEREKILGIYQKLISDKGVTYPVSYGCASVALALVAKGNLDAYLSLKLEPWDMAAAVVINREAGAMVTNIDGKEWSLEDKSILVANPALHNNLCKFFKEE